MKNCLYRLGALHLWCLCFIFTPPGECKSSLASVKFDSLASLASVNIILFPPLLYGCFRTCDKDENLVVWTPCHCLQTAIYASDALHLLKIYKIAWIRLVLKTFCYTTLLYLVKGKNRNNFVETKQVNRSNLPYASQNWLFPRFGRIPCQMVTNTLLYYMSAWLCW